MVLGKRREGERKGRRGEGEKEKAGRTGELVRFDAHLLGVCVYVGISCCCAVVG